jgi:hemerythrin-like domain-containing protein
MKNKHPGVIDLILLDHRHLRESLDVLLNEHADLGDQLSEARIFLNLLKKHSHAEEKTIYLDLENEEEFRPQVLEGIVEHRMLDQKVKMLAPKVVETPLMSDELAAEIKVLAEIVKHHIDEEEEDLLPLMRRDLSELYLADLGVRFARIRKFSVSELDEIPPEGFPIQVQRRSDENQLRTFR